MSSQNKYFSKSLKIIVPVIILATAFFFGKTKTKEPLYEDIKKLVPQAQQISKVNEQLFLAYASHNTKACPAEIISIAAAQAYAGSIKVAVIYDIDGKIKRIEIIEHSETPSFFQRVINSEFINQFRGKACHANIDSQKISTVTGATFTSAGIREAVKQANTNVRTSIFGDTAPACMTAINFGTQEIIFVLLFLVSILISFSHLDLKYKILSRRVIQIISLLIFGVLFSAMLSITHFNTLLLGFFPASQVFWYLILALFIISILFCGINIYFTHLCPFGALQDLIGMLSCKNYKVNSKFSRIFAKYSPMILTIGVISLALYQRRPGFVGHEIFATVFQLQGHLFHYILAGVIIISSLFIKRPWCRYFCPVGAVGRFLNYLRSFFK